MFRERLERSNAPLLFDWTLPLLFDWTLRNDCRFFT